MKYGLIVAALLSAVAAALGDTTRVVDGKRRLTAVGMVVIFAALLAAIGSTIVGVEADRERRRREAAESRIRSVWAPQLDRAVGQTRMLIRYLGVNAKLEQEHGPNPVDFTVAGLVENGTIESFGPGQSIPVVPESELFDLLGEFNVNPQRFPWRAWPLPPSWRPRRFQSIDQRLSASASQVLTGLDEIADEYGDVMDQDERALVEELRTDAFLLHLSTIRETAADARVREDSDFYPVHILEPGLQGAPRESLERLLQLIAPIE